MNIQLDPTNDLHTWKVTVDGVIEPGLVVRQRGTKFFVDDGVNETEYEDREDAVDALQEYLQEGYKDWISSTR